MAGLDSATDIAVLKIDAPPEALVPARVSAPLPPHSPFPPHEACSCHLRVSFSSEPSRRAGSNTLFVTMNPRLVPLVAVQIGTSNDIKVGQMCFAIGNPFGAVPLVASRMLLSLFPGSAGRGMRPSREARSVELNFIETNSAQWFSAAP